MKEVCPSPNIREDTSIQHLFNSYLMSLPSIIAIAIYHIDEYRILPLWYGEACHIASAHDYR